ncbi:MAG: adenylyltransferase/cytidyltransferase family protein [Chlamydiae bacterium]|nr:adenylyltransferase/cytidyltransferase family protein [Chlamydiota bacterium]
MKGFWKEKSLEKVIPPSLLKQKVQALKEEGKRIATLNGSFDLLHAGHLHIIYEASKQADVLIVALNSDASIKTYKDKRRPIVCLEYRLEMMAALAFVDYVTWFDEVDPRRVLGEIQPHVHINGAEYGQQCIEADVIRQGGGVLHLVERIPSLSTTNLIQKIQEICDR